MFTLLAVLHVLGLTVLLFGATMLVPLMVAWVGSDAALLAYDESILITMASGFVVWWGTRRYKRELQPRDGFLLVSLTWTTLPAFATLPLLFYFQQNGTPLSFTDAYFETVSGLTTSGATVLTGLEHLPASINVWRHFMVWLGGMGILVLAVAILPLLGVGGVQGQGHVAQLAAGCGPLFPIPVNLGTRQGLQVTAPVASIAPMIIPVPTPIIVPRMRLPVSAAPKNPAKALMSIWPSMPMLMTPERSHMMPTIAARMSGTA